MRFYVVEMFQDHLTLQARLDAANHVDRSVFAVKDTSAHQCYAGGKSGSSSRIALSRNMITSVSGHTGRDARS